jgi:hypothetical protein
VLKESKVLKEFKEHRVFKEHKEFKVLKVMMETLAVLPLIIPLIPQLRQETLVLVS